MTDEEYKKMKADYDNLTIEQKDAVDGEDNRRWYEKRKKERIQANSNHLDGLLNLKSRLEEIAFYLHVKKRRSYIVVDDFQKFDAMATETEKFLRLLDDDISEAQKELERSML